MERKLFLIINPYSGQGKIKEQLYNVVGALAKTYEVTVHPTKAPGDATEVVKNLDGSYETIVCCGGDGTLNEVVTGIMQNSNKYKLSYIPAGTLNEWSGGLGINKNMKRAANEILSDFIIPLDIGKFNDRYFSYIASFGAFTDSSYSAPQKVKNILGKVAYLFQGFKSLRKIRPIHLKITSGDKVFDEQFIFGSVSNSLSAGGVVHFKKEEIDLSDGLFEVLLIRYPKNIFWLFSTLIGILKKDMDRKTIEFFRTDDITITGGADVDWTLDGEHEFPSETVNIKNLHSAIDFIVPKLANQKAEIKEGEE